MATRSDPSNVVTPTDSGTSITATGNGPTQTNDFGAGAYIWVKTGTVTGTSPTLAIQLQVNLDGTNWINFGPAVANLTTTGHSALIAVYPSNVSQAAGVTPANLTTGATSQVVLNAPLPRTWRLSYTIGGTATPTFPVTIKVQYLS